MQAKFNQQDSNSSNGRLIVDANGKPIKSRVTFMDRWKKKSSKAKAVIITSAAAIALIAGTLTNIDIIVSFFKSEESPSPFDVIEKAFDANTQGVLVGNFRKAGNTPDSTNGIDIQNSIVSTLNAILNSENIKDVSVKSLPNYREFNINSHKDARSVANKYGAEIVIWGDITIAGIIPYITIVDPESHILFATKYIKDITVLKNDLTHSELRKVLDIRLPAFTDEPKALALFMVGLKALDEKDNKKAIRYFKKALPEKPSKYVDSAFIMACIGLAYSLDDNLDSAVHFCTEALKLDPNCLVADVILAYSYFMKKELPLAIKHGVKVLNEIAGTNFNLDFELFLIGYSRLIKIKPTGQDIEAALTISKTLKDRHPEQPTGYLLAGRAYKKNGQYKKALDEFNEAIKIDKRINNALLDDRTMCYFYTKQYMLAIGEFSKYFDVFKKTSKSVFGVDKYYYRGLSYVFIGDFSLAIDDFEIATSISPKFSDAHWHKARCYEQLHLYEKAINSYESFVKSAKGNNKLNIPTAKRRILLLKKLISKNAA